MDKVEKQIQTESLTEQNILFAELVAEKVRTADYRRTIIWMAGFTIIIVISIVLSTYFVHRIYNTLHSQSTLTEGTSYTSKTTIYEKGGVIYAIGHLTKAEKEANMKHYQKRMAERDRQIETQLKRKHELEIAIERTKTATLLGSVGKVIIRPEYIAERLVEEGIVELEPIVVNIVEEIKEEIIPVISEPILAPVVEPVTEPEPKKQGKDEAPGQNKEPNPNKPDEDDKTPPGQEENPGKGKGRNK